MSKDNLTTMMETQLFLQQKLHERLPHNVVPTDIKTAGEAVDFIRLQFDSIADESRELLTALGQQSRGDKKANAVWKAWKSDNQAFRAEKLEDFSESDMSDLKDECIDVFHFLFNISLSIGLTGEEIFERYMAKNQANLDRYKNNY